MSCVDVRVEGPVGTALRFAAQHRPATVTDIWLVELHLPRLFPSGSRQRLCTQLAMISAELDSFPDGGYPRPAGTTHRIALGLLAAQFRISYLDDGATLRMDRNGAIGAAEVAAESAAAVRMIGRTVATAIAHGDIPLGCRGDADLFRMAARVAQRAAALAVPVVKEIRCPR